MVPLPRENCAGVVEFLREDYVRHLVGERHVDHELDDQAWRVIRSLDELE